MWPVALTVVRGAGGGSTRARWRAGEFLGGSDWARWRLTWTVPRWMYDDKKHVQRGKNLTNYFDVCGQRECHH